MGTTPTRESVLEGIVSALEDITAGADNGKGYLYNLTPEKVMRIPVFEGFVRFLSAAGDGPYYFVRDDGEEVPTPSSFGSQGWTTQIPVVVAHRDNRAERDPFQGAVSTGVLQNQMAGDVVACLTGNEKRGTAAIFQTTVERIDRDSHDVLENWILAWVFFTVEYETALGVP